MSHNQQGKDTVSLFEMDIPECELTYGVGECEAALGVTGPCKCHNTDASCQFPSAFSPVTKVIRFSRPQENLAHDYGNVIPLMTGQYQVTPTLINLGGMDRDSTPLGARGKLVVDFNDSLHDDVGFDKYREERLTGEASISAGEVHFELADGADRLQPQHGAELASITVIRVGDTATRINKSGLREVMPANTPRFNYDPITHKCLGLLIEEARTNRVPHSGFESWESGVPVGWLKGVNATLTQVSGFAGSVAAARFSASIGGNTGNNRLTCSNGVIVASTTYTVSARVRRVSGLGALRLGNDNTATFALYSGTDTVAWEWVRVTFTSAPTAASTIFFFPETAGDTFEIDEVQVEQATKASSYIPTTTAAVTRNKDEPVCSDVSGFYNNIEGTLVAEVILGEFAGALQWAAQFDDGTGNQRISIVRTTSTGMERSAFNVTGQAFLGGSNTAADNTAFRYSYSFKENDFASSTNGGALVKDSTGLMPTGINTLRLGTSVAGGGPLNGHLRRLTYYPRRLKDADLIALAGSTSHPSSIVPFTNAFDPYTRGTLWSKFIARHPYYPAYTCRLREGYLGDSLESMRVHHYLMDKIEGPSQGKAKVTAKDIFSKIEEQKAVAPKASTGELLDDLAVGVTTATLSPAGIGNLEYPTSGLVAIGGSEICSFTRVDDTLTLTRKQLGTQESAHSADDVVQLVLSFVGRKAQDILYEYLVTYSAVDPAMIDKAVWDQNTADIADVFTAHIAKPTPVENLAGELCEQVGLTLFPNTSTGKIDLIPLRASNVSPTVDEKDWIIEKTLSTKRKDKDRVTQIWVYYNIKNPLESVDDANNYHSRVISPNLPAEAKYKSAAIRPIYSRYIPSGGRDAAVRCANRLKVMFEKPPVEAKFDLHVSRHGELDYAKYFNLLVDEIPDFTGKAKLTTMAPVRIAHGENQDEYVTQSVVFSEEVDDGVRRIFIENDANNIVLRELHDANFVLPVGDEIIEFIVVPGTYIGSVSTSLPAVRTGSWPTMTTPPKLIFQDPGLGLKGRFQGRGGAGGAGGTPNVANNGAPGAVGGPAFEAEVPIEVDNLYGEIWGGGGGGGGGGRSSGSIPFYDLGGGGGGGGAGTEVGTGGAGGGGSTPGQAGGNGTQNSGGIGGQGGFLSGSQQAGDGGNGGGPGQSGASGTQSFGANIGSPGAGAGPGNAVIGNANITWINEGDRRGGIS